MIMNVGWKADTAQTFLAWTMTSQVEARKLRQRLYGRDPDGHVDVRDLASHSLFSYIIKYNYMDVHEL